jgi:hypothetical protein
VRQHQAALYPEDPAKIFVDPRALAKTYPPARAFSDDAEEMEEDLEEDIEFEE